MWVYRGYDIKKRSDGLFMWGFARGPHDFHQEGYSEESLEACQDKIDSDRRARVSGGLPPMRDNPYSVKI